VSAIAPTTGQHHRHPRDRTTPPSPLLRPSPHCRHWTLSPPPASVSGLGCAEAGSGQQGSYVESYGRWRAGAEQKEPRSRACAARAEALAMGATWLRRNQTKICWAWRFGCAERSSVGAGGVLRSSDRADPCDASVGMVQMLRWRRVPLEAVTRAMAPGGWPCCWCDGAMRLRI
ncbi:hypothetical protein Taro_010578, partial [Colocasia esculenta]|nr:hypothetical protein [Colocasia esculenta]